MSSLINKLLDEYYDNKKESNRAVAEAKILKETKDNMAYAKEKDEIEKYLATYDKKEYLEGVKAKKWKGVIEYVQIKLGLKLSTP